MKKPGQRDIEPKNQVHYALPELTLFVLVALTLIFEMAYIRRIKGAGVI